MEQAEQIIEQLENLQEGWQISNEEEADWALMKLREVAKQEAKDKRMHEINKKRVDEWYVTAKEKTDRDREHWESLLDEYTRNKLKENKKYKLSTPNGSLSSRKKTKWTHDDKKLLERLKDTEYVQTTQKVKWGDFKKKLKVVNGKAIDENGEIVEGVTAEEVRNVIIKTADIEEGE